MKKKVFSIVFILTIISILTINSYATVNEIKNFVGMSENVMENAASNAAGMVKNGTNTIAGTMSSFMDNNSDNNSYPEQIYTTRRTSTIDTSNVSVAGINVNIWTFIIIGITTVGIIALLWSYFTQKNHNNDTDYYNN